MVLNVLGLSYFSFVFESFCHYRSKMKRKTKEEIFISHSQIIISKMYNVHMCLFFSSASSENSALQRGSALPRSAPASTASAQAAASAGARGQTQPAEDHSSIKLFIHHFISGIVIILNPIVSSEWHRDRRGRDINAAIYKGCHQITCTTENSHLAVYLFRAFWFILLFIVWWLV